MFLRRGLQTATISRPDVLKREGFLRIAGAGIIASAGPATVALAQSQARADYRLAIGRTSLELAPGHIVSTTAYNDRVPGPLIRVREGARVTIDVTNNSGSEDIVHWHGLGIPADVTAVHLATLQEDAAGAQIILTSPEFVERIGKTNADVIVVHNYFDTDELTRKLQDALE